MKLHPEDSRLTSYILGELSPEEAKAVEYAIAGDPALRLAVAEAEKAQSRLFGLLGGDTEVLLPRQREGIRRAAKEAARKGKIVTLRSHRRSRKVWLIPIAAAAAIAAGIFILTEIPASMAGKGNHVAGSNGNSPIPATPPKEDPGAGRDGAVLMPLRVGKESMAKISSAVRVAGRKPSLAEVSVPGMLNAFPLKASGSVALKDGCKLGADVIPCPWKPSGSLVLVEVHGARDGARDISVAFRADSGSVISHRLIGYPPVSGEPEIATSSRMEPNAGMLLMIEVESRTPMLGELIWSVGGADAPAIQLVRNPESEPSDDARFAALVCAFGMWLRGEDADTLDEPVVLGLGREVAADGLVADRYDFLELVDQAMKLPGK